MNPLFWAIILSMFPIGELRAGIPVAIASGIHPVLALTVCVLANMAIVPLMWFFLEFIHHRFMHHGRYRSLFDRFMERTRNKAHALVEKYGVLGLALFVAVPLPGTGAFAATALSWFFGMSKLKAFFSIFLGLIGAGLIVLAITLGVIHFTALV